MLVWLASYPRSGNTFFRLMLKECYGVSTYSIYNDPDLVRIGADDAVGHRLLEGSLDEIKQSPDIHLVKTHDLPDDDSPAIYLVRDGRDAVVSLARYNMSFKSPRKLPKNGGFPAVLKDVITNDVHYGTWGPHVKAWHDRGNIAVMRFEDLVSDPVPWLEKAVAQLDLPLQRVSESFPSFDELHEKWPKFFRRGRVGGWREEMSWRLHRLFWKRHGDAMRLLGYER